MFLLQLYDVIRQQTQSLPTSRWSGKKSLDVESGCSVRNTVRVTALTWTLDLLNVKIVCQGCVKTETETQVLDRPSCVASLPVQNVQELLCKLGEYNKRTKDGRLPLLPLHPFVCVCGVNA